MLKSAFAQDASSFSSGVQLSTAAEGTEIQGFRNLICSQGGIDTHFVPNDLDAESILA